MILQIISETETIISIDNAKDEGADIDKFHNKILELKDRKIISVNMEFEESAKMGDIEDLGSILNTENVVKSVTIKIKD